MRNRKQLLLALTAGLLVITSSAQAQTPQVTTKVERYTKQAQQAFQDGLYKKAETSWLTVVKTLQDNELEGVDLANAHKRLGETYLKEQQFEKAEASLKRSAQIYEKLGAADQEVIQDLAELSKGYKPIDTSCLGQSACDILKEANLTSVVLLKTDKGNKVQIKLPQKFTKKIADSPDVDQVGLEKIVTFDIEETNDGTVKVSNIKGLRVHAHMWVTLQESQLKRNDQGERVADITAQKMGISKTVSTTLPAVAYEPIDGLIKQFRDFANGTASTSDIATGSPTYTPVGTANITSQATIINQTTNGAPTDKASNIPNGTANDTATDKANGTTDTYGVSTTSGDNTEPVATDPATGEPVTAPDRNAPLNY